MREFVGRCTHCQKVIFCLEGFLNGVVISEKELICFECVDNQENNQERKKGDTEGLD